MADIADIVLPLPSKELLLKLESEKNDDIFDYDESTSSDNLEKDLLCMPPSLQQKYKQLYYKHNITFECYDPQSFFQAGDNTVMYIYNIHYTLYTIHHTIFT